MRTSTRRASHLLRWYPRSWRLAHGEEFTALLEDSLSDRPFWPYRSVDIAWTGLLLRFKGLTAAPLGRRQTRRVGAWLGRLGIPPVAHVALRRTLESVLVAFGASLFVFALAGALPGR